MLVSPTVFWTRPLGSQIIQSHTRKCANHIQEDVSAQSSKSRENGGRGALSRSFGAGGLAQADGLNPKQLRVHPLSDL